MTAVEPVAWRYRQDSWDDLWRLSTAQPVYQYTKIEPLYSQATVDTLRAQLEAAEAGNHRRSDSEPTWAELTQHWKARAEAAEAECERLRGLLQQTAAVGITMLFDSHKDDVRAEFSTDELMEVVAVSEPLNTEGAQVEKVYRTAWDAARTKEETK